LLKRAEGDKLYPGIWQIITGKIERKEKAFETALREVQEESALKPQRLFVLPHTTTFYSPKTDAISLIPLFVCIVKDDNVTLSDEHSEFRWLDVKKAARQLYFKSQKENVKFIESNLYSKERLKTFTEIKF
jgi:dATP pyrophosphohydrolase